MVVTIKWRRGRNDGDGLSMSTKLQLQGSKEVWCLSAQDSHCRDPEALDVNVTYFFKELEERIRNVWTIKK